MTIKYNIPVFIGRLLLVTLMIIILITLVVFIFEGEKYDETVVLIFFFVLFPAFIFSFVKSILQETYDLIVEDEKVILSRPLVGTRKVIEIKASKGFSTSEIKFGTRWGKSLFKSKSVIIYTDEFGPIELIGYNYWKFDKIENKLRELGLLYLGQEDYKTEMFMRKYSF